MRGKTVECCVIHSMSRSSSSTRCSTPVFPLASAERKHSQCGHACSWFLLTLAADFMSCIQAPEAKKRVLQALIDLVVGDASR